MTDRERELLMVLKDLLEICRYKCGPNDEVILPNGITNEQVLIAATNLVKRVEGPQQCPPGTLSNAVIRRRNGGVKHQFEDDIGGCSANYR
jgi:hypothetical protein